MVEFSDGTSKPVKDPCPLKPAQTFAVGTRVALSIRSGFKISLGTVQYFEPFRELDGTHTWGYTICHDDGILGRMMEVDVAASLTEDQENCFPTGDSKKMTSLIQILVDVLQIRRNRKDRRRVTDSRNARRIVMSAISLLKIHQNQHKSSL